MRGTLKALSALLVYPCAELQAATGEIRSVLSAERALPPQVLESLDVLLRRMSGDDLMDLQAEYTALFDGSRSLSLHLFEHVHGESRERGQALIDLAGEYMKRGFVISANELSDFLPLFLEFLSFIEPTEAREWLGRPAHVLVAMEERLRERGSPYAAVFHALVLLPDREADPQAVAELRLRMSAEEARSVDERWEDAPVTFTAPNPAPRPAGVTARIRTMLQRDSRPE
ncbi:MAG: nitrate reductase molybdenum cofactor assembly chaperone [Burkholderiales bacterium]|nr:nitrate reductase molybdenum cofactor assembly chaperone [Burkholderiales bacterium]